MRKKLLTVFLVLSVAVIACWGCWGDASSNTCFRCSVAGIDPTGYVFSGKQWTIGPYPGYTLASFAAANMEALWRKSGYTDVKATGCVQINCGGKCLSLPPDKIAPQDVAPAGTVVPAQPGTLVDPGLAPLGLGGGAGSDDCSAPPSSGAPTCNFPTQATISMCLNCLKDNCGTYYCSCLADDATACVSAANCFLNGASYPAGSHAFSTQDFTGCMIICRDSLGACPSACSDAP
jgi:hypothetical protein